MKKLLLLLILFLNFTACKKRYEEGPLISFRSVVNRVTGNWKPEYLEMNGNDVSFFIDSLEVDSYGFTNDKGTFCGSDRCPVLQIFMALPKQCELNFYWWLDNKKINLFIRQRRDDCPDDKLNDSVSMPLPALIYADQYLQYKRDEIWKIQKLTMKKMWLEMDYNGNNYKAHFVKIRELDNGI